jgi:hypothetical protein
MFADRTRLTAQRRLFRILTRIAQGTRLWFARFGAGRATRLREIGLIGEFFV